MTFWESFWLIVEVFLFFAYLVVLFQIVGDLFRDRTTSGLVKALWIVLLILFPLLGSIVYLISRGRGMTERSVAAVAQQKAATDGYIRTVAGTSPAQEIAAAQGLLASGAITDAEFADLKARALTA